MARFGGDIPPLQAKVNTAELGVTKDSEILGELVIFCSTFVGTLAFGGLHKQH